MNERSNTTVVFLVLRMRFAGDPVSVVMEETARHLQATSVRVDLVLMPFAV